MLEYKDHTLAAIVADRHQAAAVFEKYHLDFCCKGKRTLQEACSEKNMPVEPILEELQEVFEPGFAVEDQLLSSMSVSELTDYIVLKHHVFVKHAMPVIYQHLYRVATKHATTFRISMAELRAFEEDLHCHIHLENNILFPRIAKMMQ